MRTLFANKKLVLAGSFAALVLGVGATTAYAQYAATSSESPVAATSLQPARATELSGLGVLKEFDEGTLILGPTNPATGQATSPQQSTPTFSDYLDAA